MSRASSFFTEEGGSVVLNMQGMFMSCNLLCLYCGNLLCFSTHDTPTVFLRIWVLFYFILYIRCLQFLFHRLIKQRVNEFLQQHKNSNNTKTQEQEYFLVKYQDAK